MKSKELLLGILEASKSGRIEGRTLFQKIVFKVDQEVPGIEVGYEFKPYHYGPFSRDILDDLESLERDSLVIIDQDRTRSGNVRYNYELTKSGHERAQKALNRLDDDTRKDLKELVREMESKPIFVLLDELYENYPSYAEKSKYKS